MQCNIRVSGLDYSNDGKINITNYPVFGVYMPDASACFTVKDKTYIITANEGDAREYGPDEKKYSLYR